MSFDYEETSGFSAFALWNALRLHFTSDSYDFFKYNGKTNVSKSTFMTRKDKYQFYKLSRKYNLDDLRSFYVANFLVKDVAWVGDLIGVEGEENFKQWQKRNQSLTYRFEQDIIGLLNSISSPSEMLAVPAAGYPILLNEVMQGTIAIETMVILNDIMNFFPMWHKKIGDTIIWPNYERKCLKYTPFVDYDKAKFKAILKESLKEYA
jgi:hypothetical protein